MKRLALALGLVGATARAESTVEPTTTTTADTAANTTANTTTMQQTSREVPPEGSRTPTLTILPRPIPSPLHPRRRMTSGMSMGAGVYCPNFGSPSQPYREYCAAQLRVALDSPVSDTHVALLLGDVLHVGGLFGFELGTPYMQLGSRRARVALALRGSFDGVISSLGRHVPGHADGGLLSFSNTYGPNLSVALSPHAAFEARVAVGWTVGGFFDGHGFDRPVYGIAAEGWLGLRFAP